MNSIKEIALAFSAAAIVTAAFSLFGANRLNSSLRYILSLGLICSVLSVAVNEDFKFFATTPQVETNVYTANELYQKQAEIIIEEILTEKGIKPNRIVANATKNEDGSIVINKIEIYCSNSKQEVINALNEKGIDCEIWVGE
ncbi:MAG: hypothetical protein IIX54_03550 [Clostridia bacterium]|nr:hypothetical protein [Clostridia bacterium]